MNAVATVFISCLLVTSTVFAAAEAPPPAAAFARLPAMTTVRLSPDGKLVAWASFEGTESFVSMYELSSGKTLRRIEADAGYTVRNLHWVDDQTLLLEISTTLALPGPAPGRGTYTVVRYLAVDAMGAPPRALLLHDENGHAIFSSRLEQMRSGRPGTVIMSSFETTEPQLVAGSPYEDGWVRSLFEVNIRTGDVSRFEAGTASTTDWILDQQGKPVARVSWHAGKRDFRIQSHRKGRWKTIYSGSSPDELYPMGLTRDALAIIAVGARGGNRELAWRVPLDGNAVTLLMDTEEEVEYAVRDRFTQVVTGLALGGARPRILWLDPRLEQIQQTIDKAFPGQIVSIYNRSEDYSRVLASVDFPGQPPTYYLVDLAKGTADTIGESYPELAGARLGIVEEASYRARDGATIPAQLTLPPDRDPGKLPLVVSPYRGPQPRADAAFDWLAQFLATRGYAVLRPQILGSAGFGSELRRAAETEGVRVLQNDLSDGIAALVERGTVDPSRICIIGASFGGYVALAAAAFTPELYACAASINGLAHLPSMYSFLRNRYGNDSDTRAFWKQLVGHSYVEGLAADSPVNSAANIRAPFLLLHSADDFVVPFSQSELLAKTLERHRKVHDLVSLKGDDHWLSNGNTRLQVLQALEPFLAGHLVAPP